MSTPKKKTRKATPQEKQYAKEAKRDIKGKSAKNSQMADRIRKGTGPSGSATGGQTTAKSQAQVSKRQMSEKVDFLENTRQGQKLNKLEQKKMNKSGSKESPRYNPEVVKKQMQDAEGRESSFNTEKYSEMKKRHRTS